MRRAVDSPLLMVFLRALIFVGLTEAIFFRLLPAPDGGPASWLFELHESLSRAGRFTFLLAFFFAMIALITIGAGTLRHHTWPPGLNGFLSVCMVSLAALGLSAFFVGRGPIFAIGFTVLSFLAMLFMAMHAFSVSPSIWGRVFAVSYASVVLCSTVGSTIQFSEFASTPDGGVALVTGLIEPALSAGEICLAFAAVAAFMAWFDFERLERSRTSPWTVAVISAIPAACLAAGSLLAPEGFTFLGEDPHPLRVVLLSSALFLGTLTASANLIDPENKARGYGLLLLVLAGFPLRITHQDMLMVLGAALVFAPRIERDVPFFIHLPDRIGPSGSLY